MKRVAILVFFVILVAFPRMGFGRESCSEERATNVALSFIHELSGHEGKGTAYIDGSKNQELTIRGPETDHLVGPVYVFESANTKQQLKVAKSGCRVIWYGDSEEKPSTWARVRRYAGKRVVIPIDRVEKEFVNVPLRDALMVARRAASAVVGADHLETLRLKESRLVDQGNTLAYVFRWVREDIEHGLRLGIWVIRISVNPETGAVYELETVESHPSQEGIIDGENALRLAKAQLDNVFGTNGCVFRSGGLSEVWSEEGRTPRRVWGLVFDCKPPDRRRRLVSVKIDAETGSPIQ